MHFRTDTTGLLLINSGRPLFNHHLTVGKRTWKIVNSLNGQYCLKQWKRRAASTVGSRLVASPCRNGRPGGGIPRSGGSITTKTRGGSRTTTTIESTRRSCYLQRGKDTSRWAEYYSDLLNKARQHIDGRDEPLTEGPLHDVTCEEVERQLNKMKNGKSCGPDGIPTEALNHLGD